MIMFGKSREVKFFLLGLLLFSGVVFFKFNPWRANPEKVVISDIRESGKILALLVEAAEKRDLKTLKKYKNYIVTLPILIPGCRKFGDNLFLFPWPPFEGKILEDGFTYIVLKSGETRPQVIGTVFEPPSFLKWQAAREAGKNFWFCPVMQVSIYYIRDVKMAGPIGHLFLLPLPGNEFKNMYPMEKLIVATHKTALNLPYSRRFKCLPRPPDD